MDKLLDNCLWNGPDGGTRCGGMGTNGDGISTHHFVDPQAPGRRVRQTDRSGCRAIAQTVPGSQGGKIQSSPDQSAIADVCKLSWLASHHQRPNFVTQETKSEY